MDAHAGVRERELGCGQGVKCKDPSDATHLGLSQEKRLIRRFYETQINQQNNDQVYIVGESRSLSLALLK